MGNAPRCTRDNRRSTFDIHRSRGARLSLALLSILPACAALAGPADKVYMPRVEAGEWELEWRAGVQDEDEGYERAFVFDVGYGITPWWFTELVVEYEGVSGAGGAVEAWEWENIFQLTEAGQYAVDLGWFAKYEAVRASGAPDELVMGPMLQKDIGSTQANLNLLFGREVGAGHSDDTTLGYAWQAKWRGNPRFELGLQGFGDFGALDHLGSQHEHRVGPAAFGLLPLGTGRKLKYDLALLLGVGDDAPDRTARLSVEYEFR
jgi:hypothetical protein